MRVREREWEGEKGGVKKRKSGEERKKGSESMFSMFTHNKHTLKVIHIHHDLGKIFIMDSPTIFLLVPNYLSDFFLCMLSIDSVVSHSIIMH